MMRIMVPPRWLNGSDIFPHLGRGIYRAAPGGVYGTGTDSTILFRDLFGPMTLLPGMMQSDIVQRARRADQAAARRPSDGRAAGASVSFLSPVQVTISKRPSWCSAIAVQFSTQSPQLR